MCVLACVWVLLMLYLYQNNMLMRTGTDVNNCWPHHWTVFITSNDSQVKENVLWNERIEVNSSGINEQVAAIEANTFLWASSSWTTVKNHIITWNTHETVHSRSSMPHRLHDFVCLFEFEFERASEYACVSVFVFVSSSFHSFEIWAMLFGWLFSSIDMIHSIFVWEL